MNSYTFIVELPCTCGIRVLAENLKDAVKMAKEAKLNVPEENPPDGVWGVSPESIQEMQHTELTDFHTEDQTADYDDASDKWEP